MRYLTHVRRAAMTAALTWPSACAAPGMPPGGRVDKAPLVLLRVTPDTGATNVRVREVTFRFDKVVSERPRGATTLDQLVVVSPSEGPVNVDWHRNTLTVRPRRGWRANTAYSVTILPGLTDLRGNALTASLHAVFSTGGVIPPGAVRGVAFDWVARRVASGARIEATMGADTLLRYVAAADSAGRFALTTLSAGALRLRAFADQNTNGRLDAREPWDSITVSLADSARHDFYLFVHDSVGPRIADVDVVDSLRLRVRFDRPVLPNTRLDSSHVTLRRSRDSVTLRITRAVSAAEYDSLAATRRRAADDSTAKADTTAAGRRSLARADSLRRVAVRDSLALAQIAALRAARDSVRHEPLPKPSRPAPAQEYVLELAEPLAVGVAVRLQARDVTGLAGATRTSEREVVRRVAPKDTTRTPTKKPSP